jgi:hypothetical protein
VPGDTITVAVAKASQISAARGEDGIPTNIVSVASTGVDHPVAADGYWRLCLTQPIVPALGNHTVTFRGSPSGSIAINHGVLIGNVILCSGQCGSLYQRCIDCAVCAAPACSASSLSVCLPTCHLSALTK